MSIQLSDSTSSSILSFTPVSSSTHSNNNIDINSPKSIIIPEQSMTNCCLDNNFTANIDDEKKKYAQSIANGKNNPKKQEYNIKNILRMNGYKFIQKMEDTLQGCVIKAKNNITDDVVAIKIANKKLSQKGLIIKNNKEYMIKQNILQEYNILKFISKFNPPNGFITAIDLFHDSKNIFIVEEFGGENFFNYIQNSFDLIDKDIIPLKEWKLHSKILLSQLCQYISWLHNHVYTCHLSLSLENMVIKGVKYDKNIKKYVNHGILSIIDYGVADIFSPSNGFMCKKYVGKKNYISPQTFNKIPFNAKANEIWCLGVCIFLIVCGFAPYKVPQTRKDNYYKLLINGQMKYAMKKWGLGKRLSNKCDDLLKKIFVLAENKRPTINEIIDHPYFHDIHIRKYTDYGLKGYLRNNMSKFNRNKGHNKIFAQKLLLKKQISQPTINQFCNDFSQEISDHYFSPKKRNGNGNQSDYESVGRKHRMSRKYKKKRKSANY